jgi:predicted DNA-binding protein (MmcQ/YjbR family)
MEPLDVRDFILSLPNVEEVEPFGEDEAVVYKVGGKWFAVYIYSRPDIFAVKCHPDRAILLRDEFSAITPAWHFNKRHWNDLMVDFLPSDIVRREICHSYLTVIRRNISPKALREEYLSLALAAGIQDAELPE